MTAVMTRQRSSDLASSGNWAGRLVDNLYGEARLQPASPSFVTRRREYHRLRRWVSDRGLENNTIFAIKLFHSGAFLMLGGSVLHVTYSCARDRITRRTLASALAVASESLVIIANSGRCPLTSVVEDLGAEHGSVSDIFLPDWAARNIPQISSVLLGIGIIALAGQRFVNRCAS